MLIADLVMTKMFLAISLLIIVSTCIWVMVQNRKKYLFGIVFIPTVLIIAASIYFSLRSFEGWPILKPLASNFTLHWYVIDESKDKVYVWITRDGGDKPRAHAIPYTRLTHRNLDGIRKQLGRGDTEVRGFSYSETNTSENQQSYNFKVYAPTLRDKNPEPPKPPTKSPSGRVT